MHAFFQAYSELLSLEYFLSRKNFSAIYEKVRKAPIHRRAPGANSTESLCRAMDVAAALYFKQVRCLQRSAATACLFKRYGFAAEMVIGVQQLPFSAHAWVELDGRVLNDRPYMREMYSVMTRC